MDLVKKLANAQLKGQHAESVKKIGHYTRIGRSKYKKPQKIMTGQIISLLDLQETREVLIFTLVSDDGEVLEITPKENIICLNSIDVYPDT